LPQQPLWSAMPSGSAFITACAVGCIRADRIDHARAAGRDPASEITEQSASESADVSGGMGKLVRQRVFWHWMMVAFLFNAANMPQTQLLAQYAAEASPHSAVAFASCVLIIAHVFMAVASGLVGQFVGMCGSKRLLSLGTLVLFTRASVLTAMVTSRLQPWLVLAPSQVLDGFGVGFWHPVAVLIVQDISAGSGCFSQTMGCTLGAFCFGAVLSSVIAGQVVTMGGWAVGFGYLALMSCMAALAAASLPMTRTESLSQNLLNGGSLE